MSDSCNCIDIKAKVMMDEPKIGGKLDFDGKVIFASDGEDYKRGYEEGHEKGYSEGEKVGYDNGYDTGYEQGYSKKVDYIPYVKSIIFSSAISEITNDMYLDLSRATTLNQIFYGIPLSFDKLTIKISNLCNNFYSAFHGVSGDNLKEIEIVGDTSNVTNWQSAFKTRPKLERIIGELDFSSVTNPNNLSGMFMNDYKVKRITPKAGTIKVSISFINFAELTEESIDAIVNGFADMTGQTAPVLTFHPTVKAKIVADDEKHDTDPTKRFWLRTLTNKNVTLA